MPVEVQEATSEADRHEVYRFRYELYCEAQGVLGHLADHSSRHLRDPDDDRSTLLVARDGGRIVGTIRATWGEDGPFSPQMHEELPLGLLDGVTDPSSVLVLSRFLVAESYRGGAASSDLIVAVAAAALSRRVEVVVGDCEPHLLAYYRSLGFRPFGTLSCHATSVLVPLILLVGDRDHLDRVGSPVPLLVPEDYCPAPSRELMAVLDGAAVATLDGEEGRRRVEAVLQQAAVMPTLLEDLGPDATDRLWEEGAVLHFARGDLLIGEGTSTRTLYALLDGLVEVECDGRVVSLLSGGDVVGEMAMLLDRPRTATVRAVQTGTALALSDRAIARLLAEHPHLAARVLWNLSRVLAFKVASAERGT